MSSAAPSGDGLVYATRCICPRCGINRRTKEVRWQEGKVVQRNGSVYLSSVCPTHGMYETLYCSNGDFFRESLQFGEGVEAQLARMATGGDIEDMCTPSAEKNNLPAIVEIELLAGSGNVLTERKLQRRVDKVKVVYEGSGVQFVLQVNIKLARDMHEVNQRVAFLSDLCPQNYVVVEGSHDRLMEMVALHDSVFLRGRVYPSVKYYLRRGDEALCLQELTDLFTMLKGIHGVVVVVNMVVERPLPAIHDILAILRAHHGFVRFVTLSMERSPTDIMASLQPSNAALRNVDPWEVIRLVEECSRDTIACGDFVPARLGEVLEPFVYMWGLGTFHIRPSPLCAYVVPLVTAGAMESVPLNRVIDVRKFFFAMRDVLDKRKESKRNEIGITQAPKLRKILKQCARPGVKLPDILSFLTDKSKREATRRFVNHLQFLVIHNNMDSACIDLLRRTQCGKVACSGTAKTTMACACADVV